MILQFNDMSILSENVKIYQINLIQKNLENANKTF
jgi:hypothetical protein